jgi:AcrR family transcriptional regulator
MVAQERAWLEPIVAAVLQDGRPLERLTLAEIARLAGISRATLMRRIGSRGELERAAQAAGVSLSPVASVRDRAAAAAAELIETGGLAGLTIDAVAERAGCSVPAVYRVFENRDGLLLEVFRRYTPVGRIVEALTPAPRDLAGAVRAIYRAHVSAWGDRPALVRALLADLAGNAEGSVRRVLLRGFPRRVLPLVFDVYARAVAAGESRPYPLPIFMPLIAAPLMAHIATRDLVSGLMPLPPWEETIELLADAACRAVAPDPGDPIPKTLPPFDADDVLAALAGLGGARGDEGPMPKDEGRRTKDQGGAGGAGAVPRARGPRPVVVRPSKRGGR